MQTTSNEHGYELFSAYDANMDDLSFTDNSANAGDDEEFIYVCGSDIDDAIQYAIGYGDDSDTSAFEHERKTLRRWLTDPDYYGCDVMDVSYELVERQRDGEHITCDDVREAMHDLVDRVISIAYINTGITDAWQNEMAMARPIAYIA